MSASARYAPDVLLQRLRSKPRVRHRLPRFRFQNPFREVRSKVTSKRVIWLSQFLRAIPSSSKRLSLEPGAPARMPVDHDCRELSHPRSILSVLQPQSEKASLPRERWIHRSRSFRDRLNQLSARLNQESRDQEQTPNRLFRSQSRRRKHHQSTSNCCRAIPGSDYRTAFFRNFVQSDAC